jgi:hypothetical protein
MKDIIIWLLLLFVFIIIIGLYVSEYTPLDLNEKEKILNMNYITENFSPSVSSTGDQLEGSSEFYNWGVPDNNTYSPNKPPPPPPQCHVECTPSCPPKCPHLCPPIQPPPMPHVSCPHSNISSVESCRKCDITQNKDIDKYVLKSSIPPCPDMSEFITKNMMNANPDLSDYILKSEIKPCEKIDISAYILKSEIPACPNCPVCPVCPVCPKCNDCPKCPSVPHKSEEKEIYNYNITEHPNIKNYISLDELNKNYVKKEELNKALNKSSTAASTEASKKQNKDNNSNSCSHPNSKNHIGEEMYSELLGNNNNIGYYVGDSLYAGV